MALSLRPLNVQKIEQLEMKMKIERQEAKMKAFGGNQDFFDPEK